LRGEGRREKGGLGDGETGRLGVKERETLNF
jgi:hypothetical protein